MKLSLVSADQVSSVDSCACVQVLGPGNQPCPCQVLHRPQPLSPAEANLLLGAHRPAVWHRSSLAGLQLNGLLRRGIGLLDRTNSVGVRDCLLVSLCEPQCGIGPVWPA